MKLFNSSRPASFSLDVKILVIQFKYHSENLVFNARGDVGN